MWMKTSLTWDKKMCVVCSIVVWQREYGHQQVELDTFRHAHLTKPACSTTVERKRGLVLFGSLHFLQAHFAKTPNQPINSDKNRERGDAAGQGRSGVKGCAESLYCSILLQPYEVPLIYWCICLMLGQGLGAPCALACLVTARCPFCWY